MDTGCVDCDGIVLASQDVDVNVSEEVDVIEYDTDCDVSDVDIGGVVDLDGTVLACGDVVEYDDDT